MLATLATQMRQAAETKKENWVASKKSLATCSPPRRHPDEISFLFRGDGAYSRARRFVFTFTTMADEPNTVKKPGKKTGVPKGVRPGGRAKGTQNKVTATARENILAVFTRLGGTAEMARWAKLHQTEFYKLYARLIPVEVTGKDGGAIEFQIKERNALRDTILATAAAISEEEPTQQLH